KPRSDRSACPGRSAAWSEAERCAADPRPFRPLAVPDQRRTASRCAASGTRIQIPPGLTAHEIVLRCGQDEKPWSSSYLEPEPPPASGLCRPDLDPRPSAPRPMHKEGVRAMIHFARLRSAAALAALVVATAVSTASADPMNPFEALFGPLRPPVSAPAYAN